MPSKFFTPVMADIEPKSLQKTKTHSLQNCSMRSLLAEEDPLRPRLTGSKVIVTIGPATEDVATLCELLQAGMACARFDLTFASLSYHDQAMANLEEARRLTGLTCAVMVDTLGRELLIVNTQEGGAGEAKVIPVHKGSRVVLTADQSLPAYSERLPINHPQLASHVLPGDSLVVGRYLNTGADGCSLLLKVVAIEGQDIVCTAESEAELSGLCTLVLMGDRTARHSILADMPVLSQLDEQALRTLGSKYAIDYVAVSYACNAEDLEDMRSFCDRNGLHNTKLICKLEHTQALYNFCKLAGIADAFIISRGNLGLHVPCEKMALVQKQVVAQCNHLGKPVFITRIVDTMVDTPRPTRAEATDVANGILDGADGVLLGAETMRGKYPVITLKTVLGICKEAEVAFDHAEHYEDMISELIEADGGMKAALGTTYNVRRESPRNRIVNRSNFGSAVDLSVLSGSQHGGNGYIQHVASNASITSNGSTGAPVKGQGSSSISPLNLEALASSAVRAVAKVQARLLICFGSTGRTASLISKYRPPVPIYTVVMHKAYTGDKQHAAYLSRQLAFLRGVVPVLAAPDAEENEGMLHDAITQALQLGLIHAGDTCVCIMALKENMVLKMVTVNHQGTGLCKVGSESSIRPDAASHGFHTASTLTGPICKAGSLP